jgi:hypothetical protein
MATRNDLIRIAGKLSKGDARRRKLLGLLKDADFNPGEIGELESGPLQDEPDEPYMDDQFTQQEFQELGDKQESGQLGDMTPDEGEAKMAGAKTAAERRAALVGEEQTLFTNLVKLAFKDADARGPILAMLCDEGLVDCPKTASGCDKLPEGPMRDNCKKKVEEGKDDKGKDDKDDDKK